MKIIIIGAGAAGYFAAIHAAESGAEVIVLEKSNKTLSKVKVSGGGRCNVTNACDEPELLVKNYPRGSRELRGPFSQFNTTHTVTWFESRGVPLKAEADGRVFPVSDSSQTIIDCLNYELKKLGIKIQLQTAVKGIIVRDNVFEIETSGGVVIANKIIIATGGSPAMDSYNWLAALGHKVIQPVPSLFTFNMPGSPFSELMGVAVNNVNIKIAGSNFTQYGPLLFTHWGLSGPVVLKLSAWGARWLNENSYNFNVIINFAPAMKEQEVRDVFREMMISSGAKKIFSNRMFDLPVRIWEKLCVLSGVKSDMNWADAGKTIINKLVNNITALSLPVSGKTTFKEEFVTCGGVDLKEVDMKTMQSKKVPGLFFAGEVLDIDGVTGGFNFQAAWTTGYIAGISAAKNSEQ